MRRTAALLLASTTALTAAADASPKWNAWADAGAFHNNHDDGRGEVTLWTPLDQSADTVTFLDLRGKLFGAGELEGNLAFGYREQHDGWNLGVWAGFDLRRSALDSTFPQVSAGIEALSQDWDLRLNGYLPIDDSDLVSTSTTSGPATPTILLNGNSILLQTGTATTTSTITELAFGGVDAEIGVSAPLELLDLDAKKLDLRLYGGGFYFDNGDAPESISGPKARLELRINDVIDALPGSRLTVEAEYTDDDVRGDRSEFGLRLRIPLGETPALASTAQQDARMTEGLRRDTDVVTSAKTTSSTALGATTTEAVKDAATDVVLSKLVYVDGNTSGGLTPLATSQGANTLIIAQGSSGNIDGTSVLQQDQTLVGGGSTIALQGVVSGTVAHFTAPGSRPTLTNSLGFGGIVFVTTNTHVSGVDITSSFGDIGVRPNTPIPNVGLSNIVIDHNTITLGSDGTGVGFLLGGKTGTNITIDSNNISGMYQGIVADGLGNSRISNNTIVTVLPTLAFLGQSDIGLQINSSVATYSNLLIDSNVVSTSNSGGSAGVFISGDAALQLDILNNTVTSNYALIFGTNNSTGTISNNRFTTTNLGTNFPLVILNGTSNNSFIGSGNIGVNNNPGPILCAPGTNPNTNIQFVGGGHCP